MLVLLFITLIKSNNCLSNSNNFRQQAVIIPVVSATKYISIFLCMAYGIKGAKKAIKSAQLLLPPGSDLKVVDIVKFPFKLVLEFPFKACGAIKYFVLAGAFGSYAFVAHKAGF